MTINKFQNQYLNLITGSILAIFSVVFLANVPMAHAEGYNRGGYSGYSSNYGSSYNYGGNYGGNYGDRGGNYGGNYGGHGGYDNNRGNYYPYHEVIPPPLTPTHIYVQEPTYTYVQPSPTYVYEQPTYQYQQPIVYQQPTYQYQQPTTYYQSTPTTYYSNTTQYQNTNLGSLVVTCASDPSTAFINQPVTWTASVTNGLAPYTYSWTGSDGLTGTQNSVLKYYSSLGQKSAVVTVTSSDGLTGTISCSNSLTVRSSANTTSNTSTNNSTTNTTTNTATTSAVNQNSAAAFGSIGGISFGIFAILIILLLIGTIFYIVLSRSKI